MRAAGPRTIIAVGALAALATAGLSAVTSTASAAPSSGPVVNEAYGGGGNSGATLKNDCGRYLVGEAAGAGGTTDLPPTQATGTTNLSGTLGTVALVNSTTALTCKTAADCAADASVVDLVGYGTAPRSWLSTPSRPAASRSSRPTAASRL